ncbi:MAG: Gfo/Idh/MocA family oxidoreductase [Bacteroidota bacterium]
MRNNVALIGAGQIGSRHLQGLALSKIPLNIQLIDPSNESLDLARKRYEEVTPAAEHLLTLHNSINDVFADIDVAIVATSSNVRRAVVEQLLSTINVKYLILEKVLFQKIEDYEAVSKLLVNKNVSAWVNHPRRMQQFYKDLQTEIGTETHINMNVIGNNWGLACNALHFLDLYAFITSSTELAVNTQCLDAKILDSKRSGFVEFTGTLTGNDIKGNSYTLSCFDTHIVPTHILFSTPTKRILINEGDCADVLVANEATNWKYELRETFQPLYQSKLSGILAEDLLSKATCDLPTYNSSSSLHVSFISALLQHINTITGKIHTTCPIT